MEHKLKISTAVLALFVFLFLFSLETQAQNSAVGADGRTFDQRSSDWISSIANQQTARGLSFNPQDGRQHVLAWAATGTHGGSTCRSTDALQAVFNENTPCLKTAEGSCAGPYIDEGFGVEKFVDPYSGATTWNDLMCIDGSIQGLVAWKDQSGSFSPATLARLYLQFHYPNSELQSFFREVAGDSNFFDASPSDSQGSADMQPIKTAVHYLSAMQSSGTSVTYGNRGPYFSRTFSYGGRTYTPGGTYNALTFTRDWMVALMDSILKRPNEETNSASYQSRAISAWRLLNDFGEPDMQRRAKMSLDLLFLDAGMQFSMNVNQWGGLLGRTYRAVYEGGWADTMPWYIYWGAKREHSSGLEGYVSLYRMPSLVEGMPYLSGGQWILKRDSYRNNVFNTNSFVLAAGPDGGQEWRIVVRREDGGYPFEFWINDFAGDLDGGACGSPGQTVNGRTVSPCGGGECYCCLGANGSLYRNNILLENLSNPVMHLSSDGQSFDQVQGSLQRTDQWNNEYWLSNYQWTFLLRGNTAIAINPGPGTGGVEVARIDPSCSEDFCYSSFSDFTSRSRSIGSGSFTNGKGIVIDHSKTYTRAPGRLVASSSDSPNLVTWDNNVMTVSRDGLTCRYDFNAWAMSGNGCGAQTPPGSIFSDVGAGHWARGAIETLYRAGFVAGCSTQPLSYCPEADMTRGEMAVFVERGAHSAGYMPPHPTQVVFGDVPLSEWFARWADGLWRDRYTAGCGTAPLLFCPRKAHTRAEATVYFERMMNGPDYKPGQPGAAVYDDVLPTEWYGKWVAAAHRDGLVQECEDLQNRGDRLFRPLEGLTRAEAACMLVKAKGLVIP